MAGRKRIENRSWITHHRGRIAIHECGPGGRGILGTAKISEIVPSAEALARWPEQAPYIIGPMCWVLTEIVELAKPIACKGSLGLWAGPDIATCAVGEQSGEKS